MRRSCSNQGAFSRRSFLQGIGALPILVCPGVAFAQNASDINGIIKRLAPIEGQVHRGGYDPDAARRVPLEEIQQKVAKSYKPKHVEKIIVRERVIVVDLDYRMDFEVYFDYDSAKITPRAREQLKDLGRALSSPELQGFRYLVAGHTDAVGSDEYNIDLSERRARAVYEFLTQTYAIDSDRLTSVGFGFRRLKNKKNPKAAINRRVEVMLIVPEFVSLAPAKDCTGLATGYTIVLSGFDSDAINQIEQTVVAFSGYAHHRPIRSQTRYIEYWYETCADRARLERNLRMMIEQMPVQSRLALNGNRFEIERIAGVGRR